MGKIDSKRRKSLIKIRQKRKRKLALLRELYSAAKTETEKNKVLGKLKKIASKLSKEEFLGSIKS
jgi:hypothetical protein